MKEEDVFIHVFSKDWMVKSLLNLCEVGVEEADIKWLLPICRVPSKDGSLQWADQVRDAGTV